MCSPRRPTGLYASQARPGGPVRTHSSHTTTLLHLAHVEHPAPGACGVCGVAGWCTGRCDRDRDLKDHISATGPRRACTPVESAARRGRGREGSLSVCLHGRWVFASLLSAARSGALSAVSRDSHLASCITAPKRCLVLADFLQQTICLDRHFRGPPSHSRCSGRGWSLSPVHLIHSICTRLSGMPFATTSTPRSLVVLPLYMSLILLSLLPPCIYLVWLPLFLP